MCWVWDPPPDSQRASLQFSLQTPGFEWYTGHQKSQWQGHHTRSFMIVARRGHHSNGHHNIQTGQGMRSQGMSACVSGLELPSRDTWLDSHS